ncbi:MAG: hypothetical protein P8Z33_14815, partial [Gammaproteobacteria bacterium]
KRCIFERASGNFLARHLYSGRFSRKQTISLSEGYGLLSACDFNRSMQHLSSNYRAEDVADEAQTEDLLHTRAERADVGSLAGWRFHV